MQQEVVDILKEIAKKNNLPYDVVKAVYKSQFQVIKETASKGTFEDPESFLNIRIKRLGLFYVNKKRLKFFLEHGKKKNK